MRVILKFVLCTYSGLASSAIGNCSKIMGTISLHQQCQGHDHLQLFVGIDGHSFPAICCKALRVAVSAQHVSRQIPGSILSACQRHQYHWHVRGPRAIRIAEQTNTGWTVSRIPRILQQFQVCRPHDDSYRQSQAIYIFHWLIKFSFSVGCSYDKYAISVRTAGVLPIEECRIVRTAKNEAHAWGNLCIEGNSSVDKIKNWS